jgi:ATP-dependent helicase/nuclease subunit B
VQATFLLGPAGSGKTFRCLADIRADLIASPEGPPLILLAPKQATFQLERQLLADPALQGYTRLRILSFERLAEFILDELGVAAPDSLSEEGRVMVLRALLIQRQGELRIFRGSARLTGFARELSLLLREFQRHHLAPARLDELAAQSAASPQLRDKLHDLALLLRAYGDWLKQHGLQDANHLLDVASGALREPAKAGRGELKIAGLWLDGFAEMTPQELDLLAALVSLCQRATLAFCLDPERAAETSWLSSWSMVGQTFSKCRARLESLPGVEVIIEALKRDPPKNRFVASSPLRELESSWDQPTTQHASDADDGRERGRGGFSESPNAQHASGIQLVACANPEAEAVFAAREILRHARAGGRFRECAVIVRSLEPCHATLARVFRRYGIPFFLDRRESVAHHPLAELTRFAVRTVAFNWRHDDWLGALKSGLVRAREADLDWLENAALQFGWEGNVWRQPITLPANVSLAERGEQLRQGIVPPFDAFTQQAGAPLNGMQLAAALRKLWVELQVEKTLEDWSESVESETHSTVWEQMNGWLANLVLAFPHEATTLRDWLPILEAGLANLTVGVIPPSLDQVLIGAIDRSRNPDLKLALVLGLNEGIFPAPPAHGALLTDAERTTLDREGVYLGPTVLQRLGHERYYGYIACTRASERLVLTRATHDAEGQPLNPSSLLEHVRQITGATEEKFIGPEAWRTGEHVCELEAPVLRAEASLERNATFDEAPPHPAFGHPLPHRGRGKGVGAVEPLLQLTELPSFATLVQKWRQWTDAVADNRLASSIARQLYGQELKTSVSALEDFAACPFKFFAARGLRLEERKEFQFDDRDKGSFQHEVLKEFHRRIRATGRLWRHLGVVEARVMIASIAEELMAQFEHGKFLADGAARFTGEFLAERLGDLVAALIEWMAQYEFDPALAEIGFGLEAGDLPAWQLKLPGGRTLRLRGRIDRVDLHHTDDETALAVVMDYKSRPRRLNNIKLHHGLELQLLSYLGVLQHLKEPEKFFGAKKLLPVGVFYVPLNGGGGRSGSTRAEILAADAASRRAAYQHSGRFLADVLRQFDNRGEARGDQFKYALNKGGSLAARGNEAIPQADFEALRQKTEDFLREYGQRIFAGDAEVAPFRIGQQTACDYCDFRAVCRFDPWTQPYRNLRLPK